jgi:hypothetical protein
VLDHHPQAGERIMLEDDVEATVTRGGRVWHMILRVMTDDDRELLVRYSLYNGRG